MTGGPIARLQPARDPNLPQLVQEALDYAQAGVAPNTARAYGSDWADFTSWCASVGAAPLPAAATTVALYLTARAQTLAVSTLARRLAAIKAAHRKAGHAEPGSSELELVWSGIRRTRGRPPRKKRGLGVADLEAVVAALPATLTGGRDRAVLLVGFASALRRSELAAMSLAGPGSAGRQVVVEILAEGLLIEVRRAKGDQEGRGAPVAVPFGRRICPVAALRAWLDAAQIREGPVFRPVDRHGRVGCEALSDRSIAEIVKRACHAAGYDPRDFAGHSLRRGFITAAHRGGAAPDALMRHARHAKFETTLAYIEEAERFRNSAAGKAGL